MNRRDLEPVAAVRAMAVIGLLALAVVGLWGRAVSDDVPQSALGSRGNVTVDGAMVQITGLGAGDVAHDVIVANDATVGNLLVRVGATVATAGAIPAPADDITVLGRVVPVFPGEKLVLDSGVRRIGLRAETVTVAARVIVTRADP